MASTTTGGGGGDRMATRQNKQMIIRVGTVTLILLLIIDCVLLYMWLSYGTRTITKTVTKKTIGRRLVPHHYRREDEDSYLLLEEISPIGLGHRDRRIPQHMCNTSGCLWLKGYLRQGGDVSSRIYGQSQRASRSTPCDDFYDHVCGDRQRSIYEDAAVRLMSAVTPRLLGKRGGTSDRTRDVQEILGNEEPEVDDDGVMERCLRGDAVLSKGDIVRACRDDHSEEACPIWVPDGPLRTSEDYFRDNPDTSIEDFAAFVQSLAPSLNRKRHARQQKADSTRPFSKHWITRVCRWVALSARCHLERIRPQTRSPQKLALYQRTWEVIYFAPFMGGKARPLVQNAYRTPTEACLRIAEDLSRRRTAQAAREVISEAMQQGLDDMLAHFAWEAGQVMRMLVPKWLAPQTSNATSGDEDDSAERLDDREAASQRLGAIEVHLMDPSMAKDNVSVYSWKARYSEDRKTVLVPPGLFAILLNASTIIEPVLVPMLGRELLRALMPTSQGPYAWRPRNQRRLEALVDCVASGLDVVSVEKVAAVMVAT
ncbi:uncharacterized protein LOC144103628 [Amblyomma americanum]